MNKQALTKHDIAKALANLQRLGLVEPTGEYRKSEPVFGTTRQSKELEAKYPNKADFWEAAERHAAKTQK